MLISCSVPNQTTPTALPTDQSTVTNIATPSPTAYIPPAGYVEYDAQSGDTAIVVAAHFGTEVDKIISPETIPPQGLINPDQKLFLPAYQGATTATDLLIPDSDVVFSPSAADFDLKQFVDSTNGKLNGYSEVATSTLSGAEILFQLGRDYSINPRILLSLLESQSGWVSGKPQTHDQAYYPYGWVKPNEEGLLRQTGWAVKSLTAGYYGWRAGTLTQLVFQDKSVLRLAPNLNAGTVAVMYALSLTHSLSDWQQSLQSLVQTHSRLFGDPWQRAKTVEPLFPAGLQQPELRFPFPINETWNYTCGPHTAWGDTGQPLAALDFAPPLDSTGCGVSPHWAVAVAPGLILRYYNGAMIEDLDSDGKEQTGWVILYMHIGGLEHVPAGTQVNTGDHIGHPSCEGGSSSGIHTHIARMYNGEWVLADGGLPFNLSGYQAKSSNKFCEGLLVKGDVIVNAYPWGSWKTKICQPDSQKCKMATPTPIPSVTPTFHPRSIPTMLATPKK